MGLSSACRNRKKLEIISKFLKNLINISFDRYFFTDYNNFVATELHGYCDASKTAYSAVIYARTTYNDKMTVKYVSAKSKVASSKGLSIPRIELFSCVLLSKFVEVLVSKTLCWTDSLVVLRRIERVEKNWKVCIENIVRKIKEKVGNSSWRHIPGELNPSDIATRECRPKVLPQSWFHGIEFLESLNEKWPVFETVPASTPPEVGIGELRTKLTINTLLMTKLMSLVLERLLIVSVLVILKNC